MDMSEKIKNRRTELNMTQEELAGKLSVSRSTVSNWETGRNYPDMQTIVSIADILGLSLDEMMREDCEMIRKLAEDTKERKKQSRKVKALSVALILFLIIGTAFYLKTKSWEMDRAEQIVSVEKTESAITVKTELPKYMGISGYYMGSSFNGDREEVEITIMISVDLTMKNQEEAIIELAEDSAFKDTNTLSFVSHGEAFKTMDLNQ